MGAQHGSGCLQETLVHLDGCTPTHCPIIHNDCANWYISIYRHGAQGMAEGEGFEPPLACAKAVFKTAAINRTRPSLREL